jgi:hypothetical protein
MLAVIITDRAELVEDLGLEHSPHALMACAVGLEVFAFGIRTDTAVSFR